MKVLNSLIVGICIISGLIMTPQYCFGENIPIRKDNPVPPGSRGSNGITTMIPVEATINDSELAIYFETSIGDATVTVEDASNFTVYQEDVDTSTTSEWHIPADLWTSGNYTLTIVYDTTTLRGDFAVQ